MPYITEVRTVNQERDVVIGATCDNCHAVMEPVFVSHDGEVTNFVGALRVSVSGGYGEYLDGGGSVMLCNVCATELERLIILAPAFSQAND